MRRKTIFNQGLLNQAAQLCQQVLQISPDYAPAMHTLGLIAYQAVDIALDTFPRSGGTTAVDALWMGVPVVTMVGEHYVQRLATSKLNAIGHSEWIDDSPEKYVDIAVALGKDRAALSQTKTSLRDAFMASDLFDYDGLATHMEIAYQEMWQAYLNGSVAASYCSSR